MKTAIRIAMVFAGIILMSCNIYARNDHETKRISREEFARVQAQRIAQELAFDKETTTRFIETYCRCQKEIWESGRGRKTKRHQRCDSTDIEKRFEMSQKRLDIRKKYYKEYSTFLTQEQIERVYEIERQMMYRLSRHKRPGKR